MNNATSRIATVVALIPGIIGFVVFVYIINLVLEVMR